MFRRLWNLFFGWLGLGIAGLERANPQALLQKVQDDMRKDVAQYNQGLIAQQASVEALLSQIKREERESADLTAKVAALVKAGKNQQAAPLALQLQKVKTELAANREQAATARTTYENLTRMRDAAIEKAKSKINEIKSNLSQKQRNEALANLTETASGMISNIGATGETLDRLSQIAEEGNNQAKARLTVAAGALDISDANTYIEEQQALGDAALAQFMAEQGITPAGATDAPATDKTDSMGPVNLTNNI